MSRLSQEDTPAAHQVVIRVPVYNGEKHSDQVQAGLVPEYSDRVIPITALPGDGLYLCLSSTREDPAKPSILIERQPDDLSIRQASELIDHLKALQGASNGRNGR